MIILNKAEFVLPVRTGVLCLHRDANSYLRVTPGR